MSKLVVLLSEKTVRKYLTFILIGLALLIRFWQMEYIPYQSDGDELAFVFAGQSLWEYGHPISWSSFEYPEEYVYDQVTLGEESLNADDTFTLVEPWFDHPPFLSLMIGGWVELWGYRFPSIPPSFLLRVPMVILSGILLWGIYRLSSTWESQAAGRFSLLLIGFSPTLIFAHRMVVGENLIAILLIWSLIISEKMNSSSKKIILLAALATLAGLIKITGLLVVAVVGLYLLLHKNWKSAITFGVLSLIFFGITYFSYGFLIDPERFLTLLSIQSHRLVGWLNPAFILSQPGFHTGKVLDLSYYLLLLFGFWPVLKAETAKQKFLLLSLIGSIALIWMSGAEQDMLGWYKLPLFALLAVTAGPIIKQIDNRAIGLLLSLVAINNLGLVKYPTHPLPPAEVLRIVVGFTLLIYIISFFVQKKKQVKLISRAAFLLGACLYIGSALYVNHYYYRSNCKDKYCPVPELTTKQLLTNLR